MRPHKARRPAPAAADRGPSGNDRGGHQINTKAKPTTDLKQPARFYARAADRAADARRPLAARHIPDETPRATYAAIDQMVTQLPYGYWLDESGRLVIFNRGYLPIWQKLPNGEIQRANPREWVRWVEERWFNADRIRYEKTTRERLREILRKFFAGEDLERFTTGDVRYRAAEVRR
ncbi:MAG TPA: hypothetical protein VIJ52_04580 [Pseudolabrys sp.]